MACCDEVKHTHRLLSFHYSPELLVYILKQSVSLQDVKSVTSLQSAHTDDDKHHQLSIICSLTVNTDILHQETIN